MSKPTLWISAGTCSLAPHILFQESGQEFETLMVDVISNGGFPAKHREVNPKMRVPILELHDAAGSVLTETVAIMTYISATTPASAGAAFFGRTPLEAARTYEWLNWLSGTVHERALGSFFSPHRFTDDEAGHTAVRRRSRAVIDEYFGMINGWLEGRDYAVADGIFTAADAFLYVMYRWGFLFGADMPGLYPNWTRLVHKVSQRDAVKKAVEREGIPLIIDNRASEELQAKLKET